MAPTDLQPGDASKGTYRAIQTTDVQRTVDIGCPNCGKFHRLTEATISPDGDVRPVVLCECGFNDYVRLVGWANPKAGYPSARRGNPQRG